MNLLCRAGWHRWRLDEPEVRRRLEIAFAVVLGLAPALPRPAGVAQRCTRCGARRLWRPS